MFCGYLDSWSSSLFPVNPDPRIFHFGFSRNMDIVLLFPTSHICVRVPRELKFCSVVLMPQKRPGKSAKGEEAARLASYEEVIDAAIYQACTIAL